MTDLTPDTIAETRRLLEQWNDPEVDRHSAWLVACALANHLPALLDRWEAAERVAKEMEKGSPTWTWPARARIAHWAALLRGKDVFDFTENQRKAG